MYQIDTSVYTVGNIIRLVSYCGYHGSWPTGMEIGAVFVVANINDDGDVNIISPTGQTLTLHHDCFALTNQVFARVEYADTDA